MLLVPYPSLVNKETRQKLGIRTQAWTVQTVQVWVFWLILVESKQGRIQGIQVSYR